MSRTPQAANGGRSSGRYPLRFFVVFLLLCAFAVYVAETAPSYRGDNAIRFDTLGPRRVVVTTGLSRTQQVFLKAGFLEHSRPVHVGVIGNHQIQYLASTDLGYAVGDGRFFNFWSAASGLPDNRNFLLVLEKNKVLPKKIIVHITTPNNDNGDAILKGDHNMVEVLRALGVGMTFESFGEATLWWAHYAIKKIDNVFNYITFLTGLTQRSAVVTVDLDACAKASGQSSLHWGWLRFLPNTIHSVFAEPGSQYFCQPRFLRASFRADGSSMPPEPQTLKLDDNPVREELRYLQFGDDERIERVMREIAAIAERNGRELVFWVPPVYESARSSVVDRIFDLALARVKDLRVVDHRYAGRGHPKFFYIYDHPNSAYFAEFAAELRRIGFLEQTSSPAHP